MIFDDGVVITLKEREIAAPCEYQLLTALIQEIDRYHESHESQPPQSTKPQKLTDNSSDNSGWSKNKLAKRLVNEVLKSSPIPITCTNGIESNATNELVSNLYNYAATSISTTTSRKETSSTENCMVHHHGLLMVIDMTPPPILSNSNLLRRRRHKQLIQVTTITDRPENTYREILSASRKMRIPTILQKIVTNICQDREAASIIAHQHMCYQNRVFSTTSMPMNNSQSKVSISGEKRKKRSIFF